MFNSLSSLGGRTVSNRGDFEDYRPSKRRRLPSPTRNAAEEDPFVVSDPFTNMELYALPGSLVDSSSKNLASSTRKLSQQALIAYPPTCKQTSFAEDAAPMRCLSVRHPILISPVLLVCNVLDLIKSVVYGLLTNGCKLIHQRGYHIMPPANKVCLQIGSVCWASTASMRFCLIGQVALSPYLYQIRIPTMRIIASRQSKP